MINSNLYCKVSKAMPNEMCINEMCIIDSHQDFLP